METYFLFLRRDLRDSASAWLMGATLFTLLVLANHAYDLSETPFEGLYYCAVAFIFASPGIPYRRIVWGIGGASTLSRPYLKTLPLKHTQSFWLCFARGLPGNLPLALYLLWVFPHFNIPATVASRLKGFPILPRSAHPSEYALCLLFTVLFLFYSEVFSAANSILEERLTKTTNRTARALNRLGSLALFCFVMGIFSGLCWMAFCLFYGLSLGGLTWMTAIVALPATIGLLLWTYWAWASG